MDTLIADHPLTALFLLSFLAATLVPLGSEWLLALQVAAGHEPLSAIATATAGNTLGACTTYLIGLYGGVWLIRRFWRVSPQSQQRAERFYQRYGSWSLLLSWVPIIGDPLCLVGGVLRIDFGRFLVLVACGKLGRYAVVGWLVSSTVS